MAKDYKKDYKDSEPSILEIKFALDLLIITFLKDDRFAGRTLTIMGEALSWGFDAYPSSMKWGKGKPYENEEIDDETRASLVRKILKYKSPTGFEITMHQDQDRKTNKERTWSNLVMRGLIFVLILLIFIGMLKRIFEALSN